MEYNEKEKKGWRVLIFEQSESRRGIILKEKGKRKLTRPWKLQIGVQRKPKLPFTLTNPKKKSER